MSELVPDASPDPPRPTNDTQATGTFLKIVKNVRNTVDLAVRAFSASSRQRERSNEQNYNHRTRNEYKDEFSNNKNSRGDNPMPIINTFIGNTNVTLTQSFSNNYNNNPPKQQKHKVYINKKQYRRIDLYIRQLAGVSANITPQDILKIKKSVKNWKKVATELGLGDSDIKQHSDNYRAEKVDEIFYKLIISWEQSVGRQATIGKLAEALWFSREFDAIEKLAENYGYGSTSQ